MGVPSLKVFILECLAFRVDAVAARTISFSDVTALNDEAVNDAMNAASEVV